MKFLSCILILFFASALSAQDRRGAFYVDGRLKNISVSPKGKIWLVTQSGTMYYSNNIDSLWHFAPKLSADSGRRLTDNLGLEKISFFNKDTAILTGYMYANSKIHKNNGYYLTKDGGQHWQLRSLAIEYGVTTICNDGHGRAWIGAVPRLLCYSDDYGQTWKQNTLHLRSAGAECIFMSDPENGIIGADNELLLTTDNWKTTKPVKTPMDQGKYGDGQDPQGYSEPKISKVLRWKNYWLVKQNYRFFYSDIKLIQWKSFPKKFIDFEKDPESEKLYALSDSLKIVSFTTPTEFQIVSEQKLKGSASDMNISMKVSGGDLFILTEHLDINRIPKDFNVYRMRGDKIKQAQNYTEDVKIAEPHIIVKGKFLKWGAANKQIYVSDKAGWYREAALEFEIRDIKLLDDSNAVFWDGIKNNYEYNLKNHRVHKYLCETPLKTFLAFPVKTIVISSSGEQGHDFVLPRHVRYTRNAEGNFAAEEDPDYDETEGGKVFKNTVSGAVLNSALTAISAGPYYIPSLSEFRIDSSDKRRYLEMIKKSYPAKYYNSGKNKTEKDFFLSIPKILDSLGESTFKKMLTSSWEQRNSREWLTIGFINENNDTLRVHHDYPDNRRAWNLPWEFVYHHQHFNSFSIEFSKFIKTCLPKSFVDFQYFDNKLLIAQIANYLYKKRKRPL